MKMHKIFAGMSAAAMAASLIMALPASADSDTSTLTWTIKNRQNTEFSNSVEITGDGQYSINIKDFGTTPSSLGSFTAGEGEKDVQFTIDSLTLVNKGISLDFAANPNVPVSLDTASGAEMPKKGYDVDAGEYYWEASWQDEPVTLYVNSDRGGSYWTISGDGSVDLAVNQGWFGFADEMTVNFTVTGYSENDTSSADDTSSSDDSTGDENGITATDFGAQIYAMGSSSWKWTSVSNNFAADGSVTMTASYDDIYAGDDAIGDMGVQFFLGEKAPLGANQGVKASIEYSITTADGSVDKSGTLDIDFVTGKTTAEVKLLEGGSSWDDLAAYGDITLTATISGIEVYDIEDDSSAADSSEADSSAADSSEADSSEASTSSVSEDSSVADTSSDTSTGSGDATSSAATTSSKAATSSGSSTTKKDSNPSTGAAAAAGAGILLAAFAVISVKKNK